MRELFEEQLRNNLVLTEKNISDYKKLTYENGDKINIGDVVLMALIYETPPTTMVDRINHNIEVDSVVRMILLNEIHFDLYLPYNDFNREATSKYPILIKK